jgi:cytochrome c oxidase subunit 2
MQANTLAGFASVVTDQHALVPRGAAAQHISQLWWVYCAILAAVCVLVVALVLLAAVKRRTRAAAAAQPPLLDRSEQRAGELAYAVGQLDPIAEARRVRHIAGGTLATLLALSLLLTESILAGGALEQLPTHDALRIAVEGRQWWWRVRYLDPQPKNMFETANEIHIPVGRSVVLQLSASDVIHSLWIPNLHGKRDLIPGHDTELVIRADQPGRYRSQCAEFCGYAHAHMALWVVAESQAMFAAWQAHQQAQAAAPRTPQQRRGQELFLGGPCVMCHAVSGTSAQASVGPDLSHVASRLSLAAARLPNTPEALSDFISHAQSLKPGAQMPDVSLPPDQLRDLVAYLEGLR